MLGSLKLNFDFANWFEGSAICNDVSKGFCKKMRPLSVDLYTFAFLLAILIRFFRLIGSEGDCESGYSLRVGNLDLLFCLKIMGFGVTQ